VTVSLGAVMSHLRFRPVAGDFVFTFSLNASRFLQTASPRALTKEPQILSAHKDIAIAFGFWFSLKFKLYLIKEFQRLMDE
jgi:hypothetical protein